MKSLYTSTCLIFLLVVGFTQPAMAELGIGGGDNSELLAFEFFLRSQDGLANRLDPGSEGQKKDVLSSEVLDDPGDPTPTTQLLLDYTVGFDNAFDNFLNALFEQTLDTLGENDPATQAVALANDTNSDLSFFGPLLGNVDTGLSITDLVGLLRNQQMDALSGSTAASSEFENVIQIVEQFAQAEGSLVNLIGATQNATTGLSSNTTAINKQIDSIIGANNFNSLPSANSSGTATIVDAFNVAINAEAAFRTLTDTDPFVIFEGQVTNTSETETLDVSITFEEALFEALDPNVVNLSQQILFDVVLQDTNGDGVLTAQDASFNFSAFGTANPNNPTLDNTSPLGFVDGVNFSFNDIDNDGLEDGQRVITEVTDLDIDTLLQNPENFADAENTLITHLIGSLNIEDLSPGDTADFRAILSLGDLNDPDLPLLDVEDLEALIFAGLAIAQFGFEPLVDDLANGDFDADGDVDGNDFLAWQRGESPNPLSADDLALFLAGFSNVSAPSTQLSALPEPSSLSLLLLTTVGAVTFRRR